MMRHTNALTMIKRKTNRQLHGRFVQITVLVLCLNFLAVITSIKGNLTVLSNKSESRSTHVDVFTQKQSGPQTNYFKHNITLNKT